jgi:CRP-like cAMP-binding protein
MAKTRPKSARAQLNLSPEQRAARLLEIPLFAVLKENEREVLADKLISRSMLKGQPVFLQGDPGDEMFLLLEGRIRICCESISGREITLCFLNNGGFFGEMALLDGEPRSATAFAEANGHLMVLRRADFQSFLLEVPTAGISLMAFLSERLRRANLKIQDLALLTVRERLAALLLDLAEREGEPGEDGVTIVLPKTVSHKALSGLLGTSRETVSRMCSELKDQNMIAQDGRRIVVLDLEGLRTIFADAEVR